MAGDAATPRGETRATTPRPPEATAAAILLAAMGGVIAVGAILELGWRIAGALGEPAVDGMTQLVLWVVAGMLTGMLLALLGVAALHAYAAWRIWNGVNWGWIEGVGVTVIGALFAGAMFGLNESGEPVLTSAVVVAWLVYGAAIVMTLRARAWLGPVALPLHPREAPWWFRASRRWF